MKREIKFRGKDGCGTWFFGDLHQWDNGEVYIGVHSSTWSDDGLSSQSYPTFNEIDPNTVGQFTGLYDKNGKEIYEGDFVRYHMHERGIHESEYQTGLVEFGGGRFYADLDCSTLYFCGDYEDYEVIGNKWDNPEL